MENKTKINEKELEFVVGGIATSVDDVLKKLYELVNDYPEVIVIIEAYNNNDFETVLSLLQELLENHSELAYLIED